MEEQSSSTNTGYQEAQPVSGSIQNSRGVSYGLPQPGESVSGGMPVHEQFQTEHSSIVSKPSGAGNKLRWLAFSKRKSMIVSAAIMLLVAVVSGASILILGRKTPSSEQSRANTVESQDVTLNNATISDLPKELQGDARSLFVNGDIITRGSLKVSSGGFVSVISSKSTANQTFILPDSSGTVCLDSNNCQFATANQLNQVRALTGGVSSIQGQTGAITLTGGNGIVIEGTTFSNSGVLSVGGQTGQINIGQGLSVSGGTLVNTGVIGLTSPNSSININNAGNGIYELTVGPTSGTVALGPSSAQNDPSNNSSIHINKTGSGNLLQFAVNGVDKFVIGQNGIVGTRYGGTGVDASTVQNGQLLIGDAVGGGFNLATLTKKPGSIITIENTAGGITIGNDDINCASCANDILSNLSESSPGVSNVSINTDLLTASNTVDLGSGLKPFGELYLAGSQSVRANNFKITGTPNAAYTLNLDNIGGTFAIVQSATTLTQGGNILLNGYVSADSLRAASSVTTPLITTSENAGVSAGLTIRSGIASGTSGNVSIDAGSAPTAGSLSLGVTNASAITIGRSGTAVSLPGGLTTSNAAINAGTGIITSGAINGQTISSTSIFTGTVNIQGADALTIGSSTDVGAIKFNTDGTNFVTLKSPTTGNFSLTLPNSLPVGLSCLNIDNTGQIGSQSCSSGLSGSGTQNTIAMFGAGGTSVADSLLTQSGSAINLFGPTNNATLSVGTSLTLGVNGATNPVAGLLILNDGSDPGRSVTLKSQQAGSSYTLQLPTDADNSFTCLKLENVSAGVNKISGSNCGLAGSGGNITASGTTSGKLLRFTSNGPNYTAAASLIQDDSNGIGINTAPVSGTLFTIGSANAFKVTDAGAISASASITSSGLIQSSAAGQALTLSGAPANVATQSLLQLGNAIVGGNNSANGGTYLGLNAPSSGAGSAADLIDFQAGGVKKLVVDINGNFTTAGTYKGITLQSNATGFQLSGGTASRTLTVTANSTIDQNLSTTSSTVRFNKIDILDNALSIGNGGTGLASLPSDNTILLGTSGSVYEQRVLTNSATVTIDKSTSGVIKLNAVSGGGGSCSTCANIDLGNIANVAIPNGANLQPASAGQVSLGSTGLPFSDLWLSGSNTSPASNRYRITGSGLSTGLKTLTLPNFDGTFTVLQASGSTAQGGATDELNIAGLLIAGKLRSPELKTADVGAGSQAIVIQTGAAGNGGALSGDITIKSGNANATTGTSGNIIIDSGTANTNGNITIGGTNSSAVTIARAGITTTIGGNMSLSATNPSIGATGANNLLINAGSSGILDLNNTSTGNIRLGGGLGSTGCTVTNSTGAFACDSTLNGLTVSSSSVGLSTQNLTLQGADLVLSSTLGGFTNTLSFPATNSLAVSYILPTVTSGATQTICTSELANCAGSGGGVVADTNFTVGRIPKITQTAGSKKIGDSNIFDTGTNVSIGIAGAAPTPGSRLVIQGTTTDSTASALNITDSAATSRLFVRNDGNIGIGTTAPSANLSFGNSTSQTINVIAQGTLNNNAGTSLSIVAGNAGSQTTGAIGGALNLNGGNAGGTGNNNGGNVVVSGGTATGTGTRGNVVLQASDGNVGVGTVSPTAKLHVIGTNGVNGTAGTAGVAGLIVVGGNGGTSSANSTSGGAGGDVFQTAGNGGNASGTTSSGGAAGVITLTAGNAGNSNGIAGVNGGAVTLIGGNGGDTTGAFANASGGNIVLQGGNAGTGGTGAAGYTGNISLQANGGNVGIGTSTPGALLDVNPSITGPGKVTPTGVNLAGTGTTFTSTFKIGDQITVGAETRVITVITDNVTLQVDSAFTTSTLQNYTLASANSRLAVNANGIINIGNASAPTALLTVRGTSPATVTVGNGVKATDLLSVTGAAGGITTANGQTAGAGSAITLQAGAGGAAIGSTGTGGAAGNLNLSTSNGGSFTGATSGNGGAAGVVNITAGNGGDSKALAGIAGGGINLTAGNGGNTTGAAANASGGNITLQGGAAGTGGSGTGGQYGNIILQNTGGNVGIGTSSPSALLEMRTPSQGPGTVNLTSGSSTITGNSTNFTDSFKVGDYIAIGTVNAYRITAINSKSSLTVSTTMPSTLSNASYWRASIGPGTVATSAGLNTVTGTNTSFTLTFKIGDFIYLAGESTPKTVTGITNNTSLQVNANYSTTQSSASYYNATPPSLLVVKANGLIGMGTDAPDSQLHVVQSATGIASGTMTLTATDDTTTFTTSASTTLLAGDYIVPTTSTGQARAVTTTSTGTTFTVDSPFTANVTAETFTIYRPITKITTSSGSGTVVTQGNTGRVRYYGDARNNTTITLRPEFDGAVLRADGTANQGTMIADFCAEESAPESGYNYNITACGTGEDHTYYEWTHAQTADQDYDIVLRWRVPDNFDSSALFSDHVSILGFASKSAASTDNSVKINMFNESGKRCGNTDVELVNGTVNEWGNGVSIGGFSGDADCDNIDAGEYVTFVIKMTANSTGTAGEIVRMGELEIGYKSIY